eukprot:970080-Pleurochrysis_carterae.AAC.2
MFEERTRGRKGREGGKGDEKRKDGEWDRGKNDWRGRGENGTCTTERMDPGRGEGKAGQQVVANRRSEKRMREGQGERVRE